VIDVYRVGVRERISCAHYIKGLTGSKCSRLHGHNYTVEAVVEGPLLKDSGVLVDASVLKRCLRDILSDYDHEVLNDVLNTQNASAEVLAMTVALRLSKAVSNYGVKVRSVRVWETPDVWVEVTLD
jgi:6-pyruvoyltetrahydropterin/6-carboxytetrahydropterin synthase